MPAQHEYFLPPEDDESDRRRRRRGLAALPFARMFATLVALVLLVSIGAVTTSAVLTDEVSMAAVTPEGGTLDIKVNSSTTNNQDGANANWGTFTTGDLANMYPGETRYADITLHNPGTLPATVTVSMSGSDTHADDAANQCFGFYFRERAAGADVQSIGTGTESGTAETNAGVINFDSAAGTHDLYVDGATRTDDEWAVAESHVYRLTVRMKDECRQGSGEIDGTTYASPTTATGTLSFTFNATQTPTP